jgi:hypothetical protein
MKQALCKGAPLYDQAKAKGWTIISMKNDWKTCKRFVKPI